MPLYIFDPKAGCVVEVTRGPRPPSAFPQIMRDTPAYISPVTHREVDGRAARREDLKRADCREVDPSEFRAVAHDPKYAARYGLAHEPAPPAPDWVANWQKGTGIHRAEGENL